MITTKYNLKFSNLTLENLPELKDVQKLIIEVFGYYKRAGIVHSRNQKNCKGIEKLPSVFQLFALHDIQTPTKNRRASQ